MLKGYNRKWYKVKLWAAASLLAANLLCTCSKKIKSIWKFITNGHQWANKWQTDKMLQGSLFALFYTTEGRTSLLSTETRQTTKIFLMFVGSVVLLLQIVWSCCDTEKMQKPCMLITTGENLVPPTPTLLRHQHQNCTAGAFLSLRTAILTIIKNFLLSVEHRGKFKMPIGMTDFRWILIYFYCTKKVMWCFNKYKICFMLLISLWNYSSHKSSIFSVTLNVLLLIVQITKHHLNF